MKNVPEYTILYTILGVMLLKFLGRGTAHFCTLSDWEREDPLPEMGTRR